MDSYEYLLHQIAEKLDNDANRVTELFGDGTVFQALANLDTAVDSRAWFHFARKTFDGYYLVQIQKGFLSYYQQGGEPYAPTVRMFKNLQEAAKYQVQSIGPPFVPPAPIVAPRVELPARPRPGVWFAIVATTFGACLAAMPRLRHALAWALIGIRRRRHKQLPDYVLTSAFPKTNHLGHGLVCASATASRGTMAAMSARRLKRYWTSARYRRAYFANLNA
jgi:hypothetical protein